MNKLDFKVGSKGLVKEITFIRPSVWFFRIIFAGAALIMLPHFIERDPVAHPEKTDQIGYLGTLKSNECRQSIVNDGAPLECKWVFMDENGTWWWVYSRHY